MGGITPLTTVDFPGLLAAVLFLQGCPWRCTYCHNPHLLPARAPAGIEWPVVLDFLRSRQGLLDGVVFSGGEPTLQAALSDAIGEARALGYRTALHTGGMYPDRLWPLMHGLNWIGLDIKGPWHRYDAITKRRGSGYKVLDSLQIVLSSGVAYECRTTWHPGLFTKDELYELADDLARAGVRHWVLQQCRVDGLASPEWEMPDISRLGKAFATFAVRPG